MTRIVPTGIDRRALLKSSAAAGAALATGVAMPAIAQTRPIKLGYVSPQTGPLAAFAEADKFIIGQFQAKPSRTASRSAARPFRSRSSSRTASRTRTARREVAKELIVEDKIDLMLVASTPETTNPVSTQCEIEEVPCISTVAPWQPWFIGRQANPAGGPPAGSRSSTPTTSSGASRTSSPSSPTCGARCRPTRSVGGLFPNDGDGNAWGDKKVGFPPVLEKRGYKLTDPGRYQNLTDDFSAQIAAFKNANAEIVTGVVLPPDFTTFWKQAQQQGFKPKVASIGKAILFPVAVEALGKDGNNLSSEVWWSPTHPFKSSLTGQTRGRARRRLTRPRPGKQWTQPIGFVHCAVRGRRRRAEARGRVGDAKAIVEAIAATNLDTIVGPVAVGRAERAAVRRQERRQDAAGRRPVAAARTAASTTSSSSTTRPRRTSRSAARWSRSPDGSGVRRPERRSARFAMSFELDPSLLQTQAHAENQKLCARRFGSLIASPTTSICRSPRARRSASSARTAPARRRCST